MPNTKTLKVLLADDDEDDRMFFTDAFAELKVKTQVSTVNDGVELMNYLTSADAEYPDILFLDLNMPKKGGMDCLREIKASEKLKAISIAIYSTSASEADIEETFIQGANVYIRKPNDFGQLKSLLTEVVTLKWQYITSGLNRETFLLNL